MRKYDDLLGGDEQVKKNLGFKAEAVTYVGFVGDHSGSMGEKVDPYVEDSPIRKDLARTNFNEQIASLKKESDEGMETIVTVVEFDNEIQCPYDNVPVEEIEPLEDYWTRGMTSLYDAIGYCIARIKSRMEADSRDNKAALIIIETDGYENASTDYNRHDGGRERLKDLIKEMEATGRWTFTFLGAGLDEKFAQEIGMSAGNTVVPDSLDGVAMAYCAQAAGTRSFMDDRKKGVLSKTDFYKSVDSGNANDITGGSISDGGIDGKTKDEG